MTPDEINRAGERIEQRQVESDLRTEVSLLKQTVQDNLVRRIDFLEKLAFGAIGLIVMGVLCTVGAVVIWALKAMKGG